MAKLMTVREVAAYLNMKERKVYDLVHQGRIPCSRVAGKWLFPRHLVDQWMLESSHGGVLTDRIVLVGSDDKNFLGAADYMAGKIPGAQKVVIPAAGHASNLDQPAAFNAAVDAFLQSLPPV